MLQRVKLSIKNTIKKNSGKIMIATLICALIIGFRLTTMNSNATTKEVVTPTTEVNIRENYEIKDGAPIGKIITSVGPETQLDYIETVTDTRNKQWNKVSFLFLGLTRTGYVSADYSVRSTIEVPVPVPVPVPVQFTRFVQLLKPQPAPEPVPVPVQFTRFAQL